MRDFIDGRQEFKDMLLRLHSDLLNCIDKINEPYQRQNFAEVKWYPEITLKIYASVGLDSKDGGKVVSERASRDLMREQIMQSINVKSVKLDEIL